MFSKTTRKIIDRYGANAVKRMQTQAAKYSATGKMKDGFRYEVDDEGLTIYGVHYLRWAETGRGKTSEGAKAGKPTLRESILVWIKAKGIPLWRDSRGRFIGRERMAYAIAAKIHREGTWLFRNKKRREIFSNIITEQSIQRMIEQIKTKYVFETTSDVLAQFNVPKQ